MAVHTILSFADVAGLVEIYPLGSLRTLTPIEQGIENTNYRLDTDAGPVLLTLFERRTEAAALPYLVALHDHLADRGVAVPAVVRSRAGDALQSLAGKPACLFGWLEGCAIGSPSTMQCDAAAAMLGAMHVGGDDFPRVRDNPLGPASWRALARRHRADLAALAPGLEREVDAALARIAAEWPAGLPHGTIHADLFPDNVMARGDRPSGLIDFGFACRDIIAYDVAVMHASWCFDDRDRHCPARAAALFAGYARGRGLDDRETAALPLLGTGAALRFLLTRVEDWFAGTGAAVARKDPLAFARRLRFYAAVSSDDIMGRTSE